MRGISPRDPEALMRITGYATQYDTAPRWATGFTFITTGLLLFGYARAEAEERAWKALERVSLTDAANRKVAAYSKGMRQRVRLAQAIAHDPEVLVLDEPLNGLDPLVRAETIALFRTWANEGKHVILSSHVLQEVDLISDQVVLIANGMIIAEGTIRTVREEIQEHPSQYLDSLPRRVGRGLAAVQRGSHHGNQAERRPSRPAGDDPRPGAVRAGARADRARRPSHRRRRAGRRERGRPVRVPDWRRIACAAPSPRARGRRGRSPGSSSVAPSSPSAGCGSTRWRCCPRSSSSVTASTRSGGSSGSRRHGLTDPAVMNSVQKGEAIDGREGAARNAGRRAGRDASQACPDDAARNGTTTHVDRARRRCAFRPPEHQPPDLQRANTVARIYEFEIYGAEGGRISRSAVPRREPPCSPDQGPEKAVNGSVAGGKADSWCAEDWPFFLQVDLGAARPVKRFVVKHASAGGESEESDTRDFNIQVSTDGKTFTTVATSSGAGFVDERTDYRALIYFDGRAGGPVHVRRRQAGVD